MGGASAAADEFEALHQKYDKKYGRPRGAGRPPNTGTAALSRSPEAYSSPFGPMATSHDRTTAYLQEYRVGLESMGVDTQDDPHLNAYAPTTQSQDPEVRLPSGARCGKSGLRPDSCGAPVSEGRRMPGYVPRSSRCEPRPSTGGCLAICGAMVVTRSEASGNGNTWRDGPANAIVPVKEWTSVKHGQEVTNRCSSGRTIDVSDRNILCMSVLGEKAVLASADHGLKEINVRAGQTMRKLYSQRCGHSEWVTTVSHCPDGKVLSGGMDSKLCLWNSTGAACVSLQGHLGSIARVRINAAGTLAMSGAYDRTLRAWDLRSKREVACCTGHTAPVLDFVWADDLVASGDRGGTVMLWDAATAKHISTLKGHKGHITSMLCLPDLNVGLNAAPAQGGSGTASCVATGAQDGHIRVWDLRQRLNTHNMSAHPGGAVNEIGMTLGTSPPIMVSAGADGRVLIMDPRMNFSPLFQHEDATKDFIYSMLVLDDLVFVGDGRGLVKCFDVRNGQERYTLEAGSNAIRCLGATETSLVCAGDDGNAVIFDF